MSWSRLPAQLFVTATDTGAGKTRFSTLLLRYWRECGHAALGIKPLVSGGNEDLELLAQAQEGRIAPDKLCFRSFELPAAPSVAAAAAGQEIDCEALVDWCKQAAGRGGWLAIEGAGGWMVPVRGDWCMADLAQALMLPVVVVVANRLGALNHCLLTVRDVRRRGLPFAGVVLNRMDPDVPVALLESNRLVLERDFGIPVLGEIPFGCAALTD